MRTTDEPGRRTPNPGCPQCGGGGVQRRDANGWVPALVQMSVTVPAGNAVRRVPLRWESLNAAMRLGGLYRRCACTAPLNGTGPKGPRNPDPPEAA